MFRIAICDDEDIFLEKVFEMVIEYKEKNLLDISVNKFIDSSEFIEQTENYDLVFLDVGMPYIDGFEVAQRINKVNPECYICFITSMKEEGYKGYRVNAKNFLIKPVNYMMVRNEVEKAMNDLKERKSNNVIFNVDYNKKISINVSEIVSIEASGRKCNVHCLDRTVEIREKFKKVYNRLDKKCFMSPHRSYIVNMLNIKNYNNKEIIMTENSIVPISLGRFKEVRQQYHKFLINKK